MHIDIVRPQDLSAQRIARWSQLQSQDIVLDSPFLSPHWARAVERAQGEASRVRVAVAVQGAHDLAFLPTKVGAYTAMPAGSPMCDYEALVAEPGSRLNARTLVQALGVHRLDFAHMIEGQPAFAAHARGRQMSHIVEVGEGYASYEAARRAAGVSVLKDCDKKRRKAEREAGPVTFTAFNPDPAAFEALVAWKSGQYRATNQTDVLAAPWTVRLLRDLIENRGPDFGAGIFTLHFGDRLAAVHLHIHGRRTVHGWLIAHDAEVERYSPGILLFQDILRWMGETPYTRLDLGPGDYRFKRELANAGQWVTHGFVGVPSPATLMRGAAYRMRDAAEALPLGRFSHLPGKAMRRMDRWRGLR